MAEEMSEQRVCDMLVRHEVVHCVSYLIAQFAKHPECLKDSGYNEDDLLAVMTAKDWEEPVRDHIKDLDREDLLSYLKDNDVDHDDEGPDDFLREKMMEHIDCEGGGFEDFAEGNRIDPEDCEVLEHWIVTSWLAETLKEKGEAVVELFDLWIWGRCTSGQEISLDSVIVDIARDMEILPGMKRAWTK